MPLLESRGSSSAFGYGLNSSLTDPFDGATSSISNAASGLYGRRVNADYSSDPSGLDGNNSIVSTNTVTSLDSFTSSADGYSWKWFGYFRPSVTGIYNFRTTSDDGSFLWLGTKAKTGFTMDNAVVDNRGGHGPLPAYGSKLLYANYYYPCRVHFSEGGGGDIMTLAWTPPGGSETTNGSGIFFYNTATGGF
jgi:hypothetical protein